ncbi:MAG: tetraacyldisaccharide 4'-kinase [Phycisphaerae bacterium]|nr:tetraacyldisaccharide 4'-kinase [Phycisphaerae bacterium]
MAAGSPEALPAYESLIAGRRAGVWAGLQRAALSVLSAGYRCGIGIRNAWYDYGVGVRSLPVPVISVGNLTVGGTGKTPMTLWLCEQLRREGRKPAVLSRGYRAAPGTPPDELAMLTHRCPQAVFVAHPDRLRSGLLAIESHGADVLVLDDGFQHRRVARDLEIVLIDATCPFGYGHVLPRGLLREPLSSLRRANVLVVTRADQVSAGELDALCRTLAKQALDCPILRCVHRPAGFTSLDGEPVESPAPSRRVGLFAGIARPAAFEQTIAGLGLSAVPLRWYRDHHAYAPEDVAELAALARQQDVECLVTTEKDAVKLVPLTTTWPCPVCVVRVDVDFLGGDDTILARSVRGAINEVEGSDG